MAGTAVVTITNIQQNTGVLKASIAWTADGAGTVSADEVNLPAGTVQTVEFLAGTAANLYDVDLLDVNGASMFDDGAGGSIGANLSNTVGVHKVPFINGASTTYVRSWLQGSAGGNPYQLTVSGAGAGAAGTVNIYLAQGV